MSHQRMSLSPTADNTNSTVAAARVIWHFSQVWFAEFPERSPDKRINIWGNSFGGLWCTATAAHFVAQNNKVAAGQIEGIELPLDTVGFTNGFIDALYQAEWYPEFAYNNTYGLEVIQHDVYKAAHHNFTKAGGCRDLIKHCRALGERVGPENHNTNSHANEACVEAYGYCFTYVSGAYDILSNRSDFDMAHLKPDPGPPLSNAIGYFNSGPVQEDLGVPVNFTGVSQVITMNFAATGDTVPFAGLEAMQTILDAGVKVALVYGDRDYRTPWTSAEKISLAFDWSGADDFRNAGYEFVHTNASYNGGVVRQYGNFSFTRMFQAGHGAASYQPETVIKIFNRVIANLDVATRTVAINSSSEYTSSGPSSSFYMIDEKLPPPPPVQCYVWNSNNIADRCTDEQYAALADGTAVVKDLYVVKPEGVYPGVGGA